MNVNSSFEGLLLGGLAGGKVYLEFYIYTKNF